MNDVRALWVCCAVILINMSVSAEQPPVPPFILEPTQAAWEISVHLGGPNTTTTKTEVIRIVSEITGDLKRDVIFLPGENPREVWYRGGLMLLTTEAGDRAVVIDPRAEESGIAANVLYAAGYPAVTWIDASTYRGLVTREGVECLYFEKVDPPLRAWIDATAKRPIAVEMSDTKLGFSYQVAPARPLALPLSYQQAWDRYRALAERRKQIQQLSP